VGLLLDHVKANLGQVLVHPSVNVGSLDVRAEHPVALAFAVHHVPLLDVREVDDDGVPGVVLLEHVVDMHHQGAVSCYVLTYVNTIGVGVGDGLHAALCDQVELASDQP
jgi:hypothetical protein